MSIKPLSKETIKLINSTQVISSVYSAVKELVENSLDAQAKNIEVNLVDNGLSLIQVKDNGVGISREDAPYMALPSYTSKISDFNDLDLLSTYGFRGEGLTSICQVADVTISTKTANDETMTCYTFDHDGNVISSELSHGLIGTSVEIKDLFKKMPVRRNILSNKKRINQEIKAVEILLKTYAICKPLVKFIYRVNSNVIFAKPSCKSVKEAVKLVLGIQAFSKLKHIEKKDYYLQVEFELFIPSMEVKNCEEVSQVGYQFLIVNDRPVKAKEIEKVNDAFIIFISVKHQFTKNIQCTKEKVNKRISEHFGQSTSRKFIFCVILKVSSKDLDVNLEPNKDKVFLQNETEILTEIDNALVKYYGIHDSQTSTQSDIENINCNENFNKEDERVGPAIKKRKVDSKEGNQQSNDDVHENILKEKQVSEKPDFLIVMNGPVLSDPESDEEKSTKKNETVNNSTTEAKTKQHEVPESPMFEMPVQTEIIEETLSQLPKVDLGEDFDWQEIINRNNHVPTSDAEIKQVENNNPQISDVAWSKGQVPGLQGGVTIDNYNEAESELFDFKKNVETINDSEELISDNLPLPEINEFDWKVDLKNTRRKTPTKTPGETKQRRKSLSAHADPSQTRIPFAGDNFMGPSAFSMFCAETRAKIIEENPELAPPEVALELNKQWKEISPEKREYYRDLAKQNDSLREAKSPMILPSKKPKPQISNAEKEKNRKQLVNMLENMKVNRAEEKNKNMVMRTFVPWNMNIQLLTEKFKNPKSKEEKSVVGSLSASIWIINLNSNLFVFNITELHSQLNIVDFNINEIDAEHVKQIVEKWFEVKNDMNVFHPFYAINK